MENALLIDHRLRLQSAVRHEWQTSMLRTRSSNGDIVDATKLNWPIGQKYLQKLAPVLPPYHLGQLALSLVGGGRGAVASHWGALVGFTLIFLGIARLGFQRDESVNG